MCSDMFEFRNSFLMLDFSFRLACTFTMRKLMLLFIRSTHTETKVYTTTTCKQLLAKHYTQIHLPQGETVHTYHHLKVHFFINEVGIFSI